LFFICEENPYILYKNTNLNIYVYNKYYHEHDVDALTPEQYASARPHTVGITCCNTLFIDPPANDIFDPSSKRNVLVDTRSKITLVAPQHNRLIKSSLGKGTKLHGSTRLYIYYVH
jgi:hypothetical protein